MFEGPLWIDAILILISLVAFGLGNGDLNAPIEATRPRRK